MAAPEAEELSRDWSEAAEREALREPDPRLEELGLAWMMGYKLNIYKSHLIWQLSYYLKCWVTYHLWGEGGQRGHVTILGSDQNAGLGIKMKKLTSRLA